MTQKEAERTTRTLARDNGNGIAFIGIDRGTRAQVAGGGSATGGRMHYDCSATCGCGARFGDRSLAGLRDQLACHVLACGEDVAPRSQVAKRQG